MSDEKIRVGHVLAPFGVSGAVKLFVVGRPEQLLQLKRLYVADTGWLRIRVVEAQPPAVVVSFVGVEGREGAERLRGRQVFAHEDELPALPEGEYYYHELIGLPVRAPDGQAVGEVVDVMDAGSQDVLVVRHAGGQSMVPLQAPYVEVRRAEMIVLDAPPGLLGDDDDA